MRVRHGLIALTVSIVALAAAAGSAHAADIYRQTDREWPLLGNSTQTLVVPIEQLHPAGAGVLVPCWGFGVTGPGIDYAVADLDSYGGPTDPEPGHENESDGGIPGAERQPDGTLAMPASIAKVTSRHLEVGNACEAAGWVPFTASGRLKRVMKRLKRTSRKARRARAASRRRLVRQAAAMPFDVEFAGLHHRGDGGAELVLRVRAGEIPPGTTVRGHARVILEADGPPE
jgi:hypothetical protein